ncbi:hypothetical protein SuNHUV7_26570 (plasmid) [Pseudoseohaeicola sp. NH-UV-7]|uniref:DMT family transporter n=1 Tax=unclassified Sulfitobacter TaxID=196795 RepID=UPI000E0C338F|nr:DMT family transporter [Sulfitobacter sp. JL08]AXI55547.1 permease [Sulfitobacter sp. JL08]
MSRRRGQIAAAITGVQTGLAMVLTRALADDISPMTLAFLRYSIAVMVLAPFFLRLRPARIAPADRGPILLLGVVQFGITVALVNYGLHYVSAAQGAVVFGMFPILTIALAAALGREKMTLLRVLGALISVVGVAICLGANTLPTSGFGAGLVFLAAGSAAACSIYYRPYLQKYPTLQVGAIAMFAAALSLFPASLIETPMAQLSVLLPGQWAMVLAIGFLSGAGYLLWLTALKHTGPGEATVLMGISPITAAIVGALALGEPLTAGFALGLSIAILGVSLAVLSRP